MHCSYCHGALTDNMAVSSVDVPALLCLVFSEFPVPLHHNYVLVELYSADCFPVLINILQVSFPLSRLPSHLLGELFTRLLVLR